MRFLKKTTPYGKILKILFLRFSSSHRSTCCVQILWNADGKLCVIYRTKKRNFACLSNCRYCAGCAQNLPGPAPNNVFTVLQISSKWIHFWRSYSRTREHRFLPRRLFVWFAWSYAIQPNNEVRWLLSLSFANVDWNVTVKDQFSDYLTSWVVKKLRDIGWCSQAMDTVFIRCILPTVIRCISEAVQESW